MNILEQTERLISIRGLLWDTYRQLGKWANEVEDETLHGGRSPIDSRDLRELATRIHQELERLDR